MYNTILYNCIIQIYITCYCCILYTITYSGPRENITVSLMQTDGRLIRDSISSTISKTVKRHEVYTKCRKLMSYIIIQSDVMSYVRTYDQFFF